MRGGLKASQSRKDISRERDTTNRIMRPKRAEVTPICEQEARRGGGRLSSVEGISGTFVDHRSVIAAVCDEPVEISTKCAVVGGL